MIYPFDPTGVAGSNLVAGEIHTTTEANFQDRFFLVPSYAPFFETNFVLKHVTPTGTKTLVKDVDYFLTLPYLSATRSLGFNTWGAIALNNISAIGTLNLTYQTIGGEWTADIAHVLRVLSEMAYNPRISVWESVTSVQQIFPALPHSIPLSDTTQFADLIKAIVDATATITANGRDRVAMASLVARVVTLEHDLKTHTGDLNNPHQTSTNNILR